MYSSVQSRETTDSTNFDMDTISDLRWFINQCPANLKISCPFGALNLVLKINQASEPLIIPLLLVVVEWLQGVVNTVIVEADYKPGITSIRGLTYLIRFIDMWPQVTCMYSKKKKPIQQNSKAKKIKNKKDR